MFLIKIASQITIPPTISTRTQRGFMMYVRGSFLMSGSGLSTFIQWLILDFFSRLVPQLSFVIEPLPALKCLSTFACFFNLHSSAPKYYLLPQRRLKLLLTRAILTHQLNNMYVIAIFYCKFHCFTWNWDFISSFFHWPDTAPEY